MIGSNVLFLLNAIETIFLRASSTLEFSHSLDPLRKWRVHCSSRDYLIVGTFWSCRAAVLLDLYSITSFAVANSVSGMVRPSALAVLRFDDELARRTQKPKPSYRGSGTRAS